MRRLIVSSPGPRSLPHLGAWDLKVSSISNLGAQDRSPHSRPTLGLYTLGFSKRSSHGRDCAQCEGIAFNSVLHGLSPVNHRTIYTSNERAGRGHAIGFLGNSHSERGHITSQRCQLYQRSRTGDLQSFPLPDGTIQFSSGDVSTNCDWSSETKQPASGRVSSTSSSPLSKLPGWFDYNACPAGEATATHIKDLYIHPALQRALTTLGVSVLTPQQVSVFFLLNKGKDVLLHDRRGSGKTLALLLPIINRIYQAHDLVQNLQLHRNNCPTLRRQHEDVLTTAEQGPSPDGEPSATVPSSGIGRCESVARALHRAAAEHGWRHAALTPPELLPVKEWQLHQQLRKTQMVDAEKHSFSRFEGGTPVTNPLGLFRPVVYLVPTQDAVLAALELLRSLDPLGRVGVQCLSEAGRSFKKHGMQQNPEQATGNVTDDLPLEDVSPEEWKQLGHKWRNLRLKAPNQVQCLLNSKTAASSPFSRSGSSSESPAEGDENCRIPVLFKPRVRWGCVDIVMATPAAYCEDLHRTSVEAPQPSVLVVEESDVLLQAEKQRTAMMSILGHTRPRPPVNIPHTPKKGLPALPPTQVVISGSTIPHGSPCSAGVMILEKFCSMPAVRPLHVHVMETQSRQLWLRLNSQKIIRNYERNYPAWHSERREEELREKMVQLSELTAHRFLSESPPQQREKKQHEKQRYEIEKQRRHLEEALDDLLSSPNSRRKLLQQAAFEQRVELLLMVLQHVPLRQVVVFCNSVDSCKRLAKILTEEGWPTHTYHKKLSIKRRLEAAALVRASLSMHDEAPRVLVATDLLARSGQLKALPHVVNFEFPTDVVAFMHRAALCAGSLGEEGAREGGTDGILSHIIGPEDLHLAASIQCASVRGIPVSAYFSRKRSLRKKAKSLMVPGQLQATHATNSASHEGPLCDSAPVVTEIGRKTSRFLQETATLEAPNPWREGPFFGRVDWDAEERNGFYAAPLGAIDDEGSVCVSSETKAFRKEEMRSRDTNNAARKMGSGLGTFPLSKQIAARTRGRVLLSDLLKGDFIDASEVHSPSLPQQCMGELQGGCAMNTRRAWQFWSDDEDTDLPKSRRSKGILPCSGPLSTLRPAQQKWTRESYQRLVIHRMKLQSSAAKPVEASAEIKRTRALLRNFDIS